MGRVAVTALAGRRVLVTGHTGFKGAWLTQWLRRSGAIVSGLALPREHEDGAHALLGPWDDVIEHLVDLRDAAAVHAAVAQARPEVVLHLGAQALVRRGYREPAETYATNVQGTVHLLEAVRAVGTADAVVVVTTDKVYAHDAEDRAFQEGDRLGGPDPYSSSKACAELVVAEVRRRTGLPVATARAGNVVGGGDVGGERLLPDVRHALLEGRPVELRHPRSVRPWQFVLDPLAGYLDLAEALLRDPASTPPAVNLGPEPTASGTVAEVVELAAKEWGTSAVWVQQPGDHPPEAAVLRLDPSLAAQALGWRCVIPVDTAVRWTVEWWRAHAAGDDVRALADRQISDYETRRPR